MDDGSALPSFNLASRLQNANKMLSNPGLRDPGATSRNSNGWNLSTGEYNLVFRQQRPGEVMSKKAAQPRLQSLRSRRMEMSLSRGMLPQREDASRYRTKGMNWEVTNTLMLCIASVGIPTMLHPIVVQQCLGVMLAPIYSQFLIFRREEQPSRRNLPILLH